MKGIPNPRQLKVAEMIKRNLAQIFTEKVFDRAIFNMLTFTEVRVNSNLQVALVFVDSIQKIDEVLAELNKLKVPIRAELVRRINLKFAPELNFKVDDSNEYAEEIEKILNSDEVKKDLNS
jgi:ribosome-binding factor A